jgi:hypothetical protein
MAQKTHGTTVAVGTATAATKAITAITAANPAVVTSNAHGYTAGQIVYLDAIGGMTQLNGRAFQVANPAANTFELKGCDSTNYTTYTSGGTAALKTMTAIGEVSAVPALMDGEANELPTEHLGSSAEQFLMGIQRFGGASLNLFIPATADTGQTRLRKLKELALAEAFTITLPSGLVLAFMGLVKAFKVSDIGVDGILKGDITLRHASDPGFFA